MNVLITVVTYYGLFIISLLVYLYVAYKFVWWPWSRENNGGEKKE